jgi:hypothetical protein
MNLLLWFGGGGVEVRHAEVSRKIKYCSTVASIERMLVLSLGVKCEQRWTG